MDGLKCTSCLVSLSTQEEYKSHYKSEFHTYNTKRKVLKLAPVSEEAFAQKKSESEALRTNVAQSRCNCCGITFNSYKVYLKHIRTQEIRASQSAGSSVRVHPEESCLFCDLRSGSLEGNLTHMLQSHGFFIPDIEYVSDLPGLLGYLQTKVREGLVCLYCNNYKAHSFRSVPAVQQHMIDKQHTFMNTEDEEEFEKFYEWMSKPPEVIETENGELELPNNRVAGNKQFAKYYKQFFRPRTKQSNFLALMADQYKALPVQTDWTDRDGKIAEFKELQSRLLKTGLKGNSMVVTKVDRF